LRGGKNSSSIFLALGFCGGEKINMLVCAVGFSYDAQQVT